jgi:Transglycosylase SLT domain
MIAGPRAVLLAAAWLAVGAVNTRAAPALEPLDHAVCRVIRNAARANDLPVAFMTRIIWRESSFRAAVVSRKGAEGIAQFMPATASAHGLRNPFDPEEAIPKAARLLAEWRARFGNLGLAAAAYNAGPARIASWLRGAAGLPAETRAYVRFVTLRDAAAWLASAGSQRAGDTASPSQDGACLGIVADLRREDVGGATIDPAFAPFAPWGVQLAGGFSKALALAEFARAERRYATVLGELRPMIIGRRLRYLGTRRYYQVRLPAATRQAADLLCRHIRAVGGACVALRS